MGLNPNESTTTDEYRDLNAIGVEGATVVETPDPTDDQPHAVRVVPDTFSEAVAADVLVDALGDGYLPKPDTRVIIAYRPSEQPVVINTRYTASDDNPTVKAGERVISHHASDATVRFAPDGTLHVEGDGDVEISTGDTGNVVIDGGGVRAVTDVTASGTNDNGGITGLDITRSSSVYLPQ